MARRTHDKLPNVSPGALGAAALTDCAVTICASLDRGARGRGGGRAHIGRVKLRGPRTNRTKNILGQIVHRSICTRGFGAARTICITLKPTER